MFALFVEVKGAGPRIFEDDAGQVLHDLGDVLSAAHELGHKLQVHPGPLSDGNGKGLGGGVHMGHGPVGLDGALGEHIRLALQIPGIVQNLQGTEQVVGAVLVEGLPVCPVVDEAVPGGEGVVQAAQLLLFSLDGGVCAVLVHLEGDKAVYAVPQGDHAPDTSLRRSGQLWADHDAVFPVVHLAAYQGIGVVAHIGVGGKRGGGLCPILQLRRLGLDIAALDMAHRLVEQLGKVRAGDGRHGVVLLAVLGALGCGLAQHHLRVFLKIAVDHEALRRFLGLHPLRLRDLRGAPLLQEQDVRHYLRAGVGLEGVVGQADGPQQVRPLGQILAHGGILGVHGVAAGEEGHDAAGAHLIQGLGKEVVVDGEAQFVVGPVVHLVISEGDIAHGEVVEVPPVRGLEAGHGDMGPGVELLCDAAADAVQLHAVQFRPGHALRQTAEEAAHAAGWLQDVAMLEAYVLQSLIDGADDGGAGVVGIEDGAPGRVVLLRGQGLLQLHVFFGPVLLGRIKGIRQSAPAHIAGQDVLFLRRGPALLCLNSLQGTDGVQVAAKLLLGSALAQVVVRDAEIFAPGLCLLGGAHGRELGRSFRQGRGRRRGLFCFGRWAHVQRGEGGRLRFVLRCDGSEGRRGVHGGRGFLLLAPALDGPLNLAQDQLRAVVDRTAQDGGGQLGIKLPDIGKVVLREASLGRQAAADHE